MLDKKDFDHIVGINQMMIADQERDDYLSVAYKEYLGLDKENREIFEKGLVDKIKSVVKRLNLIVDRGVL